MRYFLRAAPVPAVTPAGAAPRKVIGAELADRYGRTSALLDSAALANERTPCPLCGTPDCITDHPLEG